MSHTGYSIISALGLVLIGSLLCESKTCSEQQVYACAPSTIDDFCPYFKNAAKCLEDLQKNCTNDVVLEKITERLSYHRDMSEQCPGFPDGECFFSTLQRCQHKVPVNVKYQTNLSPEAKKSMCKEFKGRANGIRACLKLLESYCKSERAIKSTEYSITVVDDIEKKCAEVEDN